VPFHLWRRHAYQGAPTPSAALIASGSRLASFLFSANSDDGAFAGAGGAAHWHDSGRCLRAGDARRASMVLGNLAATRKAT